MLEQIEMLENPIEIFKERKACFLEYLNQAEKCLDNLQLEDCLVYLQVAAKFASFVHMGDHYSPELERLMHRLYERIDFKKKLNKKNAYINKGNSVLHIATEIYEVGGHTRVLLNWVEGDAFYTNEILVTEIEEEKYPEKLLESYNFKFTIHNLATFQGIERIIEIRKLAMKYDYIVLHTHPEDVQTYIALININIPILILNHADHRFWVGRDICNLVLEVREEGMRSSQLKRQIPKSHNIIFPIPLKVPINLSKKEARERLGLMQNEIVLLSIADQYKYTPLNGKGLKSSILEICNKYPMVRFIVIGQRDETSYWKSKDVVNNKNIQVLGKVTNVDEYYISSDIYIDSYPVSSLTSLLDGGKYGLALISFKNDTSTFEVDDVSLDNQMKLKSVVELKDLLSQMIQVPGLLEENKKKYENKIKEDHLMMNRIKELKNIYSKASMNKKLPIYNKIIPYKLEIDIPMIDLYFKNPNGLFQYTKVWAWYYEALSKDEKKKFLIHLNKNYQKNGEEYIQLLPRTLKP